MDVRIMLVDDDTLSLDSLSYMLHYYLPTVVIDTYTNPSQALLRLQGGCYAVVLTDLNMPGMTGLSLLSAARRNGSDASFIIMTGAPTEDMVTQGLQHGVFGLLHKPFDRTALIPLVQQAIECHFLRREVAALRRTLTESQVARDSLVGNSNATSGDLFQPLLPF